MIWLSLKNWWTNRKKPVTSTETKEREPMPGPFYTLSDFEVGDLVTVKPGVVPGGRYFQPIEEIGPMSIHGKIQTAIRVRGMPYYPEELILVKKRPTPTPSIKGLWA